MPSPVLGLFYIARMRLTEKRLLQMALSALEEVAAACHYRPVSRSKALARPAYLASRGRGVRSPYSFSRSVGHPRPQDRWSSVNASLNGIYLAAGVKRDTAIVSIYETARAKSMPENGSVGRRSEWPLRPRRTETQLSHSLL